MTAFFFPGTFLPNTHESTFLNKLGAQSSSQRCVHLSSASRSASITPRFGLLPFVCAPLVPLTPLICAVLLAKVDFSDLAMRSEIISTLFPGLATLSCKRFRIKGTKEKKKEEKNRKTRG